MTTKEESAREERTYNFSITLHISQPIISEATLDDYVSAYHYVEFHSRTDAKTGNYLIYYFVSNLCYGGRHYFERDPAGPMVFITCNPNHRGDVIQISGNIVLPWSKPNNRFLVIESHNGSSRPNKETNNSPRLP